MSAGPAEASATRRFGRVDSGVADPVSPAPWGLRSPHEATCRSIASHSSEKDAPCRRSPPSPSTSSPASIGTPAVPDDRRRPHRGGFRRRPAPDPGLGPPPARPPPRTGRRRSPASPPSSSASRGRSSARAPPPGCAMRACRPRRWRAASRPGPRPACRWCPRPSCRRATRRGRTVWVTRERPKIDRIACPWLIRRFVDPGAVFLFVAPAEVEGVADRFAAMPFDIENVFWSHRGELCTFDAMLEPSSASPTEPLLHLARIVRGADTARLDLAPEAAGLLAVSLGLSRMYADDLAQLEAGHGALRRALSLVPRRHRRDPQLARQQAGAPEHEHGHRRRRRRGCTARRIRPSARPRGSGSRSACSASAGRPARSR